MAVEKQRKPGEVFWPKVVLKKWLNLKGKDSEFDADEDDGDGGSEADEQENCGCDGGEARRPAGDGVDLADENSEVPPYRLRRRNSETLRAQYINTKELRICVGTFNAAGIVPAADLDVGEWLGTDGGGEPADMYVLGFQEVVPLTAGNVFGSEDVRPAQAWEDLIRGELRRTRTARPTYKYCSHPSSPSRPLDPSNASAATVDDLHLGIDTDTDADTDDDEPFSFPAPPPTEGSEAGQDEQQQQSTLLKTLNRSAMVGLAWPEQPLDLLAKHAAMNTTTASSRSFRGHRSSFRGSRIAAADDLDAAVRRKARSPFVRIVSKQMVGIFLTIWVRRSLRKCVHNLKVSTVGVGAMGYIGNKGAVSVSMSVYQTMFCFVCTHLAAGEKPGDVHKRNGDVQEIHRRTHFTGHGDVDDDLPIEIYDHEKIFWLGDLNYRIDVAYDRAHELISKMDWPQLAEKDQLKRELRKGRAFDGWSEGVLEFAPTYKYELDVDKYISDDHRGGRRTPAWCDRILSFGRGVKLLRYGRAEMTMSDHRPVAATYVAEVEVFCSRKLQRALTLTDAEVKGGQVVPAIPGF